MTEAKTEKPFARRVLLRTARYFVVSVLILAGALALLLGMLWRSEAPVTFDTAAAAQVSYEPLRQIVPGPAVPEGVAVMSSNNNVDLVRYGTDFYMAFRTAPTHFASSQTQLVVVRSSDRKTWTLETAFGLEDSDLREPRFLMYQGKLFLYFFRGGSNPLGFEPHSIYVRERSGDGAWTEPAPVYAPGYVIWRAKVWGDTAYMSVYNGSGLYTTAERAGEIRLLTSKNGRDWTPISESPQCTVIGAEEGEFEFDREGNLVATVRLEVQGALVCRASKDNLAEWESHYTTQKYDSALMFRHNEDFYVVARRNVDGAFNREVTWLPPAMQRGWNLVRYSLTRKRTALYRVDLTANTLVPLFDFPSKGDTAFPALVPLDSSSYYLVNYSCPLEGVDWPWLGGQLAGTNLYETVLRFAPGTPET